MTDRKVTNFSLCYCIQIEFVNHPRVRKLTHNVFLVFIDKKYLYTQYGFEELINM